MNFQAPARSRTKNEALQLWRNFCLGTQTWEVSWESMLWNCWTGFMNLKDEGSLDKTSHWRLFVQFGCKLLNLIGLNNVCAYIHTTGNRSVKQNSCYWGPNISGLILVFTSFMSFFDVRFTSGRLPNHLHLPKPCPRNQSMISGICFKSSLLPQEDMVMYVSERAWQWHTISE